MAAPLSKSWILKKKNRASVLARGEEINRENKWELLVNEAGTKGAHSMGRWEFLMAGEIKETLMNDPVEGLVKNKKTRCERGSGNGANVVQ